MFRKELLESMQSYWGSGLIKHRWPEPQFNNCEMCGMEIPPEDDLCEDCYDYVREQERLRENIHG